MDTSELRVEVADIETFLAMFCYCGYDPTVGRRFQFEISRRRNDTDALVKHLQSYDRHFLVTFNGVAFDGQVLQYIMDEHHKWFDLTAEEVVRRIYAFAQKCIEDGNYGLRPPYREHYMTLKQIDLFKILGYDNEVRKCSLKWAFEFSLDGDIEELPFDHRLKYLTDEQIDDVIEYCWVDVMATYEGYKICLGQTNHEDYKGKNKIQLRLDLVDEYKLSHTAVNWSDIKIGAELNKKVYLELAGIGENELWKRIKGRKLKKDFRFRDCYPSYIKFETKEFKEFFKQVGITKVNIYKKQEFKFSFNGTHYTLAKGGGHSIDKPRMIKPLPGQILIDADVGSMYPNIIRKRKIAPVHLGPLWNEGYSSNIPKRISAKKKFKETKEKKYESFAETFKYVLNGSFGKLIDRYDFQYDPFAGICTTIGGQVDIFMLAEDLELGGHHVVSMNTDGLTVLTDVNRIQSYYDICKAWERQVGNDTIGNLEYVEYEMLAQTSVNDYIAVKKADWMGDKEGKFIGVPIDRPLSDPLKVKKKGDFLTSYELHKNKSKSIIPIALEKFFTEGRLPEETIKSHRNIFDFCIAKKASRDYFYRSIDRTTGKATDLNKLVRYYCAIPAAKKQEEALKRVSEAEQINVVKAAGWKQFGKEWLYDCAGEEDEDEYPFSVKSATLEEAYQLSIPAELVPGKLYKIKHEGSDKKGPARSNCEADSPQQILFNRPFEVPWHDYGIDYNFYIQQTNKIIDKILPEYKRDRLIKERGQLSLF